MLSIYFIGVGIIFLSNLSLLGQVNCNASENPQKKLKDHHPTVEQPKVEISNQSHSEIDSDQLSNKYSYYLSKVRGLDNEFNSRNNSIHIKGIK